MNKKLLSFFVGILLFPFITVGQVTIAIQNGPNSSIVLPSITNPNLVPSNYFGMTTLGFQQQFAPLSYGTVRNYDSTDYSGNYAGWSANTNPSYGTYNWTVIDEFTSQNVGKDILFDLGKTPVWASTVPGQTGCTYGNGTCAPPIDADWQAWVTAVVNHVGSKVQYWECWNEPNYAGTWTGTAAQLAQICGEAYQIIHTINPSAIVLSPAFAGTDGYGGADLIDAFNGASWTTSNGSTDTGKDTYDVLAFHGYVTAPVEALSNMVLAYKNYNRANGKPMWDTELGWNSTSLSITQEQSWLAKTYLLQWPYVSRNIWYAYDSAAQWGQMWTSSGQNLVATAYSQVQSWMVGSTFSLCTNTSTVYTCNLTRPNGYVGQVVWDEGTTGTYTFPTGMTEQRNLNGFITPLSGTTVPITDSPILLETNYPSY